MKTSQAIRQAVDNQLNHPNITFDYTKDRSDYLCWCIVQEFGCKPFKSLATEITKLTANLQEVCRIFELETAFGHVEVSYRELQEMRFMYAEFLALYYEDQGD